MQEKQFCFVNSVLYFANKFEFSSPRNLQGSAADFTSKALRSFTKYLTVINAVIKHQER